MMKMYDIEKDDSRVLLKITGELSDKDQAEIVSGMDAKRVLVIGVGNSQEAQALEMLRQEIRERGINAVAIAFSRLEELHLEDLPEKDILLRLNNNIAPITLEAPLIPELKEIFVKESRQKKEKNYVPKNIGKPMKQLPNNKFLRGGRR